MVWKINFRIQNDEIIYNTPLRDKDIINATLLIQGVINYVMFIRFWMNTDFIWINRR